MLCEPAAGSQILPSTRSVRSVSGPTMRISRPVSKRALDALEFDVHRRPVDVGAPNRKSAYSSSAISASWAKALVG